MEQAGVQLIAAGGDVYISTITSATKATNTFVDATDSGSGKVSGAGQVMVGALRKVGEMAVSAFAEAAKATAGFLKDSVDIAGDFDQKMSVLQATSGATNEEMAQLSKKAKELGSDLTLPATSAVNAGDAMLELAKAGFTVTEQMDAAKGVLQLAAAAQIDEAKAAEINANALQSFGLEAKESVFVSDLLAASANASSIDATDMADTYKMAGSIFSAFQGPVVGSKEALIDLTTAASLLGNAGIKGSDAGTSLKQSLLQLTAPSDKAKGLMKALAEDIGVTGDIAYDAQGKMRSFPEILGLVSESTKSLSEEQRNYIVSTIFGADATRAILILMQQGPDAWDKMSAAVTRQGAAQDLAAAQTKGFNGAIEGAKSQIETLQLTIGQALTPILADLLNKYISPGIASLTDFASAIFGDQEAFDKLSPAMQAVVSVIDSVVADVQEIIGAFNDAGAGSDEFAQRIDDLATDLGAPAGLIKDIVSAVQDLIGVFTDVQKPAASVADVMAYAEKKGISLQDAMTELSGGASFLGKVIEDLNGIWNKALQVVTDVGNGYLAIAQAILPIVSQFWEDHGTEITAFLKTAYDKIMSIINVALDLYDAIVPKVLGNVAKWIEEHATGIQAVLSGAWQAISGIIDGALTLIEGVLKIALDVINGDWGKAWTDLQTMSANIVLDIQQVIEGFLNIIAGFFNTSLEGIVKVWQDNWNQLVDIATQTDWAQVGRDVVDGIIHGLANAWSSLVGWITDQMGGLVGKAIDAIDGGSPALKFMPVGQSIVQGMMLGLTDTWPQLTDLVGGLSKDLIGQMQDIGGQIQDVIADSFGATASIDRQMAKNLDAIGDIQDEFTRKIVAQDLETLKKKAMDLFPDPKDAADYYKMVSNHEFETLKLRQQIAEASTQEEKDRLNQQLILISRAQDAELDQFYAAHQGQQSPTQQIVDQINEVMKALAGINLTDDQQKIVDMLSSVWYALQNVPHRAQGGAVNAGQPYWVGEQGPELFWPQTNGMVSPAASSAQLARAANTTNYNGQVGNTFNMPIYTNNSPAALQQSWAVLQASMP